MTRIKDRKRPFKLNKKPIEDRFFEKCTKRGHDDCWHWHGAWGNAGYGQFYVDEVVMGAHRASWVIHHGMPGEGIEVCHKCDVPSCVNPNHLFLGTHAENMADMRTKGRMVMPDTVGEANSAAKLTEIDVMQIRASDEMGVDIAIRYGVSTTTVSEIRLGKTWPHLPGSRSERLIGRTQGERHPRARITASQALEIRHSKERNVDLAKRFGLTPSTIGNIKSNRIWKHI